MPPSAYVAQLFNDYANRFEEALVEKLSYTVPAKLAALVSGHVGPGHKFFDAVDLGCGTGLFGAEISANCYRLEGYDIADSMLATSAFRLFACSSAWARASASAGVARPLAMNSMKL